MQVKSAQRGVGELDQEMHLWRAADVKRGNLELTDASRKGGSCKEIRPKNSNLRARQAAAKRKTNLLMSLAWFGLIFGGDGERYLSWIQIYTERPVSCSPVSNEPCLGR